jgi:hypothetical protein
VGRIQQQFPVTQAQEQVECRRCGVVCQKVVRPAECVERSCPFLYAYDAFGHTYVGCTQGVFAVAIDVDVLRRSARRRHGFGAVRAVREPLAICPAGVERAYENREDPMGCVNPEFHELAPRDGAFRVITSA